MQRVRKRDGRSVPYERAKICRAMEKAFVEESVTISKEELDCLVDNVEAQYGSIVETTVEHIQDLVELSLMESNHFKVAKAYILYRENRRRKRATRESIEQYFLDIDTLPETLIQIEKDFSDDAYDLNQLLRKFQSFYKPQANIEDHFNALIKAAIELTNEEATRWEFIAGRFYHLLYTQKLKAAWEELPVPDDDATKKTYSELNFYDKIKRLTAMGLYGEDVLRAYSKEDLLEAGSFIDETRNGLLNYSGYDLLVGRYVIRTHNHTPLESIQEMYLGIALFLAIPETTNRLTWVRRFYDMLSLLQVTMATPTLSNARKPFHQLSSCFIDTVPDDLRGIYRSITNFANVSKFGGGMGLYFGKVRSRGSDIRGFEGAAGGVIRWIKLANDTAVAVDQLGVRQGACAVYLDVWHKDIPEFLNLRTNNGDDRMKAHDVFPAVCYPDYFWEQVETNMEGQWGLLDPHEVLTKKGFALEDTFGTEWTEKYLECLKDESISKRWIPIKELVRLIIKSAVETGTPFAFNRDTVNRANPNKHKGVIYCSNLCTEIAQNMSPSEERSETITTEDGDTVIVTKVKPGDFVVCNLASLNLGKLNVLDEAELEEVTTSVVRALDNVIELNYFPVADAEVNNSRYRPIGLGVSGYHHMLAAHHVLWESDEHLDFVDKVFDSINYYAIKASYETALDKGAYPYFQGSEWENGRYFTQRNYTSERWLALKEKIATHGLRNGYLLAIAPTSSTSIVAGTTAGIDPILNRFYYDEKKNGLIPRVAPDLTMSTYGYYTEAHRLDQSWSIKACGVRSRHVDQAQSMNLYITNDYTFRQILNLYLEAYHEGVKTVYYIRSKALEVEECKSCAL
ncbi:ribonucleoside-diphosphate reductase subunit alpha [Peptoniphilus equinus]|uniref:Ribonucleoside-diphosphate reductase n=1 Tax=Peptoniphilus equinus TaxID=3016343 RepID=A0ABY7QXD7_9FIRM|nr:ribonucleoside-diphosphate reductase subunit alpha [Peptoniphilus equinus]WBW50770.1 ribonucleoside-diphosphate reductase subunit alpha [Peptoniphilus equinus]